MKKFITLIVALFIAFTVAGCLNHHHHKKDKSVKSKARPTLYVQPQSKALPIDKAPQIIVQAEKPVAPEPSNEAPSVEVIVPGERTPEKKESEGWWFW
jgi:cell division protein FtsN